MQNVSPIGYVSLYLLHLFTHTHTHTHTHTIHKHMFWTGCKLLPSPWCCHNTEKKKIKKKKK